MTTSALPQTEGPDIAAIAAQNDAFRKLACLGIAPDQPIAGRMHVTRSLAEAEDGFMAEAVKATGEFDVFEPENDPDGCHDFGAVDIGGRRSSGKSIFMRRIAISATVLRPLTTLQPPCAC